MSMDGRLKVLDVSEFMHNHPAGASWLLNVAGKDASSDFEAIIHSKKAKKMAERMVIAEIMPSGYLESSGTKLDDRRSRYMRLVKFHGWQCLLCLLLAAQVIHRLMSK
jgi:cytochrome b involved in lipid metabolism